MDTTAITNLINDYLKRFDLTCEMGLDFCYCPDACVEEPNIYYSLLTTEKTNRTFDKFINDNFGIVVPNFIISLFHEIGHHFTNDLWTDKEQEDFEIKKAVLNPNNENDLLTYYWVEDEYKATEWAVNYIQSHAEEIEDFWNRLTEEFFKFYIDNGLEV